MSNPAPRPQEATMRVTCPLCVTETTVAEAFTFEATTVEVVPCETCKRRFGVVSVSVRKSRAMELSVPETGLRHRDGLVVFG